MLNSKLNIYFSVDSERSEFEAVCKGWRNDVYVQINDLLFHLNIYTPERLCQDFEIELKEYGYYQIESNMILVVSADKDTIIETIIKLYSYGYFEEIKPQENNKIDLMTRVY